MNARCAADFTFCPVETELAGWDGGIPTSASGICVLLPLLLSCLSRHNVLDLQTAIEIYTPLFALFLSDHDFWRSSNSLQLTRHRALCRVAVRRGIGPIGPEKHTRLLASFPEAPTFGTKDVCHFDDRLDQEMVVGVGNECHRVSKPLNVLFFGANLFLGEWWFDRSLERQRVKAFHVRHHTLASDGTIDLTQIASGRVAIRQIRDRRSTDRRREPLWLA